MRSFASLITLLALVACGDKDPVTVPMTGAPTEATDTSTSDTGEIDDTGTPLSEIDQDGDGLTADVDCDDLDASLPSLWYRDADQDGYGDAEDVITDCDQPDGYVDNAEDCNDLQGAINPEGVEYCDNIDNDCDGEIDNAEGIVYYMDDDGDGHGNPNETYLNDCVADPDLPVVSNSDDCDDTNADVNPDAIEICDSGVDNDCNGSADDEDETLDLDTQTTWYADNDTDGYGDPSDVVSSCEQPDSYITEAGDCDDTNSAIHPDALEYCDGEDNDCDGVTDEDDAIDAPTWYEDADADGYGNADSTMVACEEPSGFLSNDQDCDDTEATTNPGADEYCDEVDNDCDGDVDEDSSVDAGTWYRDADEDSYGNPDVNLIQCEQPDGYIADATDCDDGEANANPGMTEVCDGIDNDCDGTADEDDAADATTWYLDSDSDSYGDVSTTDVACEQPTSYVADATDCDDSNSTVNPAATEMCDSIDNDCDGTTDEDDAADALTWYLDTDADGFGSTSSTAACSAPSGYTDNSDDCDDADGAINPDAEEVCDDVDNDCDSSIDEDATDAVTYYPDVDSDGYGNGSGTSIESCDALSGYVTDATDCDDSEANANPGMTEVCDGIDNDCDGDSDEDDAADAATWYLDSDSDSYGDDSTTDVACDQPTGYVADNSDCDDSNSAVSPAATEMCDSIDNDCDGTTDEDDAADALTWYLDTDADGFGSTSSTAACSAPSGYTDNSDDCDDADGAINPDAEEVCDDVDNDCDSSIDEDATDAVTYYPDVDSDGYGNGSGTSIESCDALSGYVTDATDCDDSEANANPGMTEVCDGIDNDCDGMTDEDDAADAATWYADADSDSYGDASMSDIACDQPTGYVADATDCDDTDADNNPGASEVCDGEDNDCDGTTDEDLLVTYHADSDGDGFGDASTSETVCPGSQSSGYITDDSDCDDSDASISPMEDEVCDSVDNDCDGTVDENDAIDASMFYSDSDGDGYGDSEDTGYQACNPAITGDVTDNSDCDDLDATVSPDALEYCDSIDNDCDGSVDEAEAVDASTWYADVDEDGYGDSSNADIACDQPLGFVSDDSDCDDARESVNPGADEVCDADDRDENCNGSADDDDSTVTDQITWYDDGDTDGYGDASDSELSCDQPEDHVTDATDCDDTNGTINPGADEVCDSVDNDCDGTTDEDDAVDASTWYEDSDLDGYGDASSTEVACNEPSGFVSDNTDCDDSDASQNPIASESCNGEDDDCDGDVDEGVMTTWYSDSDGDGYGDDTDSGYDACTPTSSSDVADNSDCDDLDDTINPDAIETCDEVDEDCDGVSDDDASMTWYVDADGDGYGAGSALSLTCTSATSGLSEVDTDCDDDNASANPGVSSDDDCDGEDSDCDGSVDEDDTCEGDTGDTGGFDTGDTGLGDTGSPCTDDDGDGVCVEDGDCDDTDSTIYPGATELDDELDNDCDGECDEGIDGDTSCAGDTGL